MMSIGAGNIPKLIIPTKGRTTNKLNKIRIITLIIGNTTNILNKIKIIIRIIIIPNNITLIIGNTTNKLNIIKIIIIIAIIIPIGMIIKIKNKVAKIIRMGSINPTKNTRSKIKIIKRIMIIKKVIDKIIVITKTTIKIITPITVVIKIKNNTNKMIIKGKATKTKRDIIKGRAIIITGIAKIKITATPIAANTIKANHITGKITQKNAPKAFATILPATQPANSIAAIIAIIIIMGSPRIIKNKKDITIIGIPGKIKSKNPIVPKNMTAIKANISPITIIIIGIPIKPKNNIAIQINIMIIMTIRIKNKVIILNTSQK